MRLYDEDGGATINDLFNCLIKHQGCIGNLDIISSLVGLRNYLLFIRSLLKLRNDVQPTILLPEFKPQPPVTK